MFAVIWKNGTAIFNKTSQLVIPTNRSHVIACVPENRLPLRKKIFVGICMVLAFMSAHLYACHQVPKIRKKLRNRLE